MADEIDRASDIYEQFHAFKINESRVKATKRELQPKRECYWCEATLTEGKVFCDSDCAQDYERSKRLVTKGRY